MGTGSATVATVKSTGVVKKAPTQPIASMRPTTATQREAKSNPVMAGARVSAGSKVDSSKLEAQV